VKARLQVRTQAASFSDAAQTHPPRMLHEQLLSSLCENESLTIGPRRLPLPTIFLIQFDAGDSRRSPTCYLREMLPRSVLALSLLNEPLSSFSPSKNRTYELSPPL
jgi:hypothetical protein